MKVPCTNYEYANGLSMYAHKVIKKKIKDKNKRYQNDAVLQRAKAEIFGNIDKLHERNSRVKRQVTSKRAARIMSLGVNEKEKGQDHDQDQGKKSVEEYAITNASDFEVGTDDWEVW